MTDRGGSARAIVINESFRGQAVTGQQRYATEVADRLAARYDFVPARPRGASGASKLGAWAWTTTALPILARSSVLLSMTSRTPVWHPRHVIVVHDLFVLTNPEWYSRRYIASHAPLLRATLASARAVAAVSEPVAEQIRSSSLTRAPVLVAPNAPSSAFSATPNPLDASVLRKLGLRAGEFIMSVASMDPRKNLDRLVAAYGSLPTSIRKRLPLVLIGGGSSVFRQVNVGIPSGVLMAGYVTDEVLSALYRTARGVVFPSLAEGFGLPIVEARTSGARVIASDIEVFRWVGGDELEYFDPLSKESIRAALMQLVESPDVESTAVMVPPSAASRFSWESTAQVLAEACLGLAEAS